ncbi:DUF5054 domain-containing protein [Cohnella silvisoli]|uniref:DUF5054 domain-containing protein n=1 Tax=Cohnella silvisoli TaxID=2873699 RepID=A0ABV1L279_9BACL|nr:DUF5054 domain-containing protein [Cohnella silvisoli]MCD9025711.1 DUF5054 domain-containing protein [Cohnella silvisoli]
MSLITKVHVLFKTHLDIGFTDLAENVVNRYIDLYIPQAIALAEQLEEEGGTARFVWTTGSWLIHEYFKRVDDKQRAAMAHAISRGFIVWHGLPFTSHTELMDASLFRYGLSLSKRLDEQFGATTISAKMTDVPGHTRAMIPHLAESGIRYLHLGVNPASKVPAVPAVFVWRGEGGAEIIVNYADNYGNVLEIEGLQEAMVFAHTGDNCGPPTPEEITKQFAELALRFPGAEIVASTMDAFAKALSGFKERLPVVTEEIGDSWIHGVATDPLKVARYRELLRLRNKWLAEGRLLPGSKEHDELSDNLLLVAEHTWGLDEKTWLADFVHYEKSAFAAARRRDRVDGKAVPDKYRYLGQFRMHAEDLGSEALRAERLETEAAALTYSHFEKSWEEQRAYLTKAVDALANERRLVVEEAWRRLVPVPPTAILPVGTKLLPGIPVTLGGFEISFAADGSIEFMRDGKGKQWADGDHRLGVLRYQSFGVENYNEWYERYIENIHETYMWADSDFGKPGMENIQPLPTNRLYVPYVEDMILCMGEKDGINSDADIDVEVDVVHVRLRMPKEAVTKYGAAASYILEYRFSRRNDSLAVILHWHGKEANRLPEATWFSFAPAVDNPNLWRMDKMGERLSPLDVVKDGNRNLHAVGKGLTYFGADGSLELDTLDAPLLAPGERRLLSFDNQFPSLDGGFHFLLHNNVWGTNFPMWYEEDSKFRFVLTMHGTK